MCTVCAVQVFIRKCHNRFGKARGGQQKLDELDAALQAFQTDFSTTGGDFVPVVALHGIVDLLSDLLVLHVAESKKGKLQQPEQAKPWLLYLERWLVTAGFEQSEIAQAKARWLKRHPTIGTA